MEINTKNSTLPVSKRMMPTYLMQAAYREDAELVRVLLASVEDVNACDAQNRTALDYHDQSYPYHEAWAEASCGLYSETEVDEILDDVIIKHQQIEQMLLSAGAIRGKRQG